MKRARNETDRRLDVSIGRQVKAARETAGLTLADLGAAIGVTFQQVHKYEAGVHGLTAARLYSIAQCLGRPIGYFLEKAEWASPDQAPDGERLSGESGSLGPVEVGEQTDV